MAEPWAGAHAVCLASGPSLCAADVELVRLWRTEPQQDELRRVVVVNTTFRAAPWADALFGMDAKWWHAHAREINAGFQGRCYSTAAGLPSAYGVQALNRIHMPDYRNSGAGAISLAVHLGARRVTLLGYDCAHGRDGRTHWHGSHPAPLGDAVTVARWPPKFAECARALRPRAAIVNASRHTVLDCFPRGALEALLKFQHKAGIALASP